MVVRCFVSNNQSCQKQLSEAHKSSCTIHMGFQGCPGPLRELPKDLFLYPPNPRGLVILRHDKFPFSDLSSCPMLSILNFNQKGS